MLCPDVKLISQAYFLWRISAFEFWGVQVQFCLREGEVKKDREGPGKIKLIFYSQWGTRAVSHKRGIGCTPKDIIKGYNLYEIGRCRKYPPVFLLGFCMYSFQRVIYDFQINLWESWSLIYFCGSLASWWNTNSGLLHYVTLFSIGLKVDWSSGP